MKRISVLFIAIFFSSMIFGQFSFGFKGGVNNAGVTGTDIDSTIVAEFGNITGLQGGVVLTFDFSDNLSLVTELLYLQKGFNESFSFELFGASYNAEATIAFNSFEVPLLFRFSGGDDFRFYGNVGPYVNYILSGTAKYSANSEEVEGKIIFDKEPENYTGDDTYVDDAMDRLDIGLYAGGGIAKKLGNGSLFLDARYGIGFKDLNSDKAFENNTKPDSYKPIKNRNISLSIGYLFEF